MADNPDALKTSPAQYLERAKIIRWQTETMSNADVCRQLLDIAERYEELADGIERPRRGRGFPRFWDRPRPAPDWSRCR